MPVSAAIKFTQGMTTDSAGRSLIGVLTTTVTATNGNNADVEDWQWTMLDVPPGSVVPTGVVAAGPVPSFAFSPDQRGGYLLKLVVKDRFGNQAIDTRCFQITEVSGRLIPPFTSTDRSLNFAGQARGWAKYVEQWFKYVDTISGGGAPGFQSIDDTDSPVTPGVDDEIFLYNASAGAIVVNLPSAAGISNGQRYEFREIGNSEANSITINRFGSGTIEGATTYVAQQKKAIFTLVHAGSNVWYVDTSGLVIQNAGTTIAQGPYRTLNLTGSLTATAAANGKVDIAGSGGSAANIWPGVPITGDYTVLSTDQVVLYDASGGPIAITIPAGATQYRIIGFRESVGDMSNALTIAVSGGTINGDASLVIQELHALQFLYHVGGDAWISLSGVGASDIYNTYNGPFRHLIFGQGLQASVENAGILTVSSIAANAKFISYPADDPYDVDANLDETIFYTVTTAEAVLTVNLPGGLQVGKRFTFRQFGNMNGTLQIVQGVGGTIDGSLNPISLVKQNFEEVTLVFVDGGSGNDWVSLQGFTVSTEAEENSAIGPYRRLAFSPNVTYTGDVDGKFATILINPGEWPMTSYSGPDTETLADREFFIAYETSGGALDLTLPANPKQGHTVVFRETNGTADVITVYPDGGGDIDGAASFSTKEPNVTFALTHVGADFWRSTLVGLKKIPTTIVPFVAGFIETLSVSFVRATSFYLSLTNYPEKVSGVARSIRFLADIEVSTGGVTADIQLYNVTDAEAVTATQLNTTNTTSTQVDSGVLTVGGAGNLKDAKLYEVQIKQTGGGGSDTAIVTNARLEITYGA